LPFAILANGG